MTSRSYLYVPADQPTRLEKAPERGSDALIIDLEDGVAPHSKDEGRRVLADWLGRVDVGAKPEIWVRVNSFTSALPKALEKDLEAAAAPGVTGICLAKCHGPDEIARLDQLLCKAEEKNGLQAGSLRLSALIESAEGLLGVAQVATSARIERLQLGEVDLCAQLGISPSGDESELLFFRTQIVVASAAAGIGPPIGPVSTDFRDLERLRAGTIRLRRLGFGARAVIHPAQIAVVNEVFTPTEEEAAVARALVEQFDQAVAEGIGVFVDEAGRMVDEAVVRSARRTLAAAEQARQQP